MNRRLAVTGIYCIECICNNKKYVGSSIDVFVRWNGHLTLLLLNKHTNKQLQADFNKYGYISFKFSILELAPKNIKKEGLLLLEQLYIDGIHKGNLYNTKRAIAKKSSKLKVG